MNRYDSEQNEQYPSDLLKPAVLDQLIQNAQPIFGVFAQVKNINYLDYHSYLISQRSLPSWRKG